ncbi:hypothetical protein [Colwellia sp. MEBiC06753]
MKFSTDNTSPRKFRPHGRIELTIFEEGIIQYDALGPFNRELMKALEEVEQGALASFKQNFGKWCEVIIFHDSCMMLEDALAELESYLKELYEHGLAQPTAFVFQEGVEGSSLMKPKYKSVYNHAKIPYQDFNTIEGAIHWCRSQLKN